MPERVDVDVRKNVLRLYLSGNSPKQILSKFESFEIDTNLRQIHRLLDRYRGRVNPEEQLTMEVFKDLPHGAHSKYTEVQLDLMTNIIQFWLKVDNQLTAPELAAKIQEGVDVTVSDVFVRRLRFKLGWRCITPKYGQTVREPNREKRVKFCERIRDQYLQFKEHVFTDETTVQLTPNRLKSFRNVNDTEDVIVSCVKHPYKLHIWAGISWNGATSAVVFSGKVRMDSELFVRIIDEEYRDFVRRRWPEGGVWLVMDNDPKHRSRYTQAKLAEMPEVNVYDWPSESPDLNPIEVLWAHLKAYLRFQRFHTVAELLEGIREFWQNEVTVDYCRKYITHIQKVWPEVIRKNGGPTQF